MSRDRKPDFGVVAVLTTATLVCGLLLPTHPVVAGIGIGILGNLLAAELDRNGGTYARWLVRSATWLLPLDERERRVEEWHDHIASAGEHGLRPIIEAWKIVLIGAPALAWQSWRFGPLGGTDESKDQFTELLSSVLGGNESSADSVLDTEALEAVFTFVSGCQSRRVQASSDTLIRPIQVARICAAVGLDTPTVCAALLRGVLGSGRTSVSEIGTRFGSEVASLVADDATLRFTSQRATEATADVHIAIILSRANDKRVLAIKLADRLAQLRTITSRDNDEQLACARESLLVLAPIAGGLGMRAVELELEDRAFALLHPQRHGEIEAQIARRLEDRARSMRELESALRHELPTVGIEATVVANAAHVYGVHRQLGQQMASNGLPKLVQLVVTVTSVKDCYGTIGVVHSLWRPVKGEFRDYVATPVEFIAYQALHTTVVCNGEPIEVVVRSDSMAGLSDGGGLVSRYKFRTTEDRDFEVTQMEAEWARAQLFRHFDRRTADAFVAMLRRHLLDSIVYVQTPKGDVKALPEGATAMDMAYAVHSEIGNHYAKATVNGRGVRPDQELTSGDRVAIRTSRRRRPAASWLELVTTDRARREIRRAIRRSR